MPRQTITPEGIVFRTKLFKNGRGAAFAACISKNSRFCDVQVQQPARGTGTFVTFRPSNKEKQAEMLTREWDTRADRATAEGLDYIFMQAENGYFWWCYNPISMETYEVSIGDCSCPDYQYRCCKIGVQCKHMHAWELQSRAGVLGLEKVTEPVTLAPLVAAALEQTAAEQTAQYVRANVNLDF